MAASCAVHRSQNAYRDILTLAWPIITEQVMIMLVQYVDAAMVGTLGANATAAVAINQATLNLLNGLLLSVGVGFTALIARSVGAKTPEQTRKLISQAVFTILVVGVGMTLFMCGISFHLPRWLGGAPEILSDASDYLFIFSTSLLFRTASMVFTAVLRGAGDSKTPMRVNVTINLMNIVGNFLLIYPSRTVSLGSMELPLWGAGWGVQGAAISTSLSVVLGGLLMLRVMLRGKGAVRLERDMDFRPDWSLLRMVNAISLPAAGERFAMNFGMVAQTYLVTSLGTIALASHHLASTAESLCFLPPFGFSVAVTTLVGQSLGANDEKQAEVYAKDTLKMSVLLISVLAAVIFFFARPLMLLFTQDPQVVRTGVVCLKIVAFSEPFLAVGMTVSGIFKGAGDTKWPFLITLVCMWVVRILMSAIALRWFGGDLYSVWIFMCLDQATRCFLFLWRFRTGRWKRMGSFA